MAHIIHVRFTEDLLAKLDEVVEIYGKQSAAFGGTVSRSAVLRALTERAYEAVTTPKEKQ